MVAAGWLVALALLAPAPEGGPLRLGWRADGRLAAVIVREALPAAAPGGFALRDAAAGPDYQPVTGTVQTTDAGTQIDGAIAGGALGVTATIKPAKGWLEVSGAVRNLDGRDHAVSLRLDLPVACAGWRWWQRLHRTATLIKGHVRRLGSASPLGSGHAALRPIAAVDNGTATVGLALPLDWIGQYDFEADPDTGRFSVVLDMALTQATPRFAQAAPFTIYVLGEPNDWGLRAALERYYANRPDLFERHRPEAGGWFAWGDILRQPPPASDYGLMFHEQPESGAGWDHDVALGLPAYPYIEPGMYQINFGDFDHRPTPDDVVARLREWAKPETQQRRRSGGYPTQEAVRDICAAFLKSGPRQADGRLMLGGIAQYPWIDGTHWACQLPLNLNPGVPGGVGQTLLKSVDGLVAERRCSGIYLDSYSNYLDQVNHDPDQLPYLDYAPQWDAKSFKPCTTIGLAMMSWVEALWQRLPADKRSILPNLYSQSSPFPWHRFTVMGKEHWTAANGPLMQQYRMMGYHKVVTQLPAYEDMDERFLRNLLLLDVFPGGYARNATDPPVGMRASYRKLMPLFRLLDQLGWQPVTHAKAVGSPAWIERYGQPSPSAADAWPVALVVYNPFDSGVVRVRVDAEALKLPADGWVVEALDGSPVSYRRDGAALELGVGLAADSTTVLVLGNQKAQGLWRRELVDDHLRTAQACLREQQLRDGKPQEATALVTTWLSDSGFVSPDDAAHLAARLTGTEPCVRRASELLQLAAAQLKEPITAPPSREPVVPAATPGTELPWSETFTTLDPKRWRVDGQGVRVANGRLELELPRNARNTGATTVGSFPFVPRALILDTDFEYNHGPHDRYLMLGLRLSTSQGGDYVTVRMEGDAKTAELWIENQETPGSNYTYRLTPKVPFTTGQPHHLRLRMDAERFRLELDGKLVGEGLHEGDFSRARVELFTYSGHLGQGDVSWFANLRLSADGQDPAIHR